jgi:hypothetical protein
MLPKIQNRPKNERYYSKLNDNLDKSKALTFEEIQNMQHQEFLMKQMKQSIQI